MLILQEAIEVPNPRIDARKQCSGKPNKPWLEGVESYIKYVSVLLWWW